MNILVTGAGGMLGRAVCNSLSVIQDGKDSTHDGFHIEKIFPYHHDQGLEILENYCREADIVLHLAGVNRTENKEDFYKGNVEFLQRVLGFLKGRKVPIAYVSSVHVEKGENSPHKDYVKSKIEAEALLKVYARDNSSNVIIYRFPNIMGQSKPNYNSAISTFCWAIANDKPYHVNDRASKLTVAYIDDVVDKMLADINIEADRKQDGSVSYEEVSVVYDVTLGEVVDTLYELRNQPMSLDMPLMPDGSFRKKLFSLYLSYLPAEKVKYDMKMNVDERGSFTELLHLFQSGQVSVNISKPGITKGNHWHKSKWEIFIVVSGTALIQQRNIVTNEKMEFCVSGDKIEAVYMIPGWTHNIKNLSESKDLVTLMYCNEIFDSKKPDTYREDV